MPTSLYQIDLSDASGTMRRLLDFGDVIDAPLEFGVRQQAATFHPLGSPWGGALAAGGARRPLSWSRLLEHASTAEADAYVQHHPASLPFLSEGVLRVAVAGGEVWQLLEATILDVGCRRDRNGTFATLTTYQLDCGHTLPVTGLAWFPGIVHEWDLATHAGQFRHHDGNMPPMEMPQLVCRITNDGSQKWFEVSFRSDTLLTGSAATGWTGPDAAMRIDMMRSENLMQWAAGEFIDCAGSPAANGDGTYDYWCRSIYPKDSAVKTGRIWAEATGNEDVRNQPFTSMKINGVLQALPNFPYQMPEHASLMQADLIAAGWVGTTVTSSAWNVWRIEIPDVTSVAYQSQCMVFWPLYYVPDMYGNVVNPVSYRGFTGDFVNTSNIRTFIARQFGTLKFSLP